LADKTLNSHPEVQRGALSTSKPIYQQLLPSHVQRYAFKPDTLLDMNKSITEQINLSKKYEPFKSPSQKRFETYTYQTM
jgi:hypothetical protein